MIKLKSIFIEGFKDPNRQVQIQFSEEPVTVIYGANGSGKTTLLKIIHAIFSKNEAYLREENVKKIQINYWDSEKPTNPIHIFVGKKVEWSDNIKDITAQTSILFGVDRGFIQKKDRLDRRNELIRNAYKKNSDKDLMYDKFSDKSILNADNDQYTANHIEVNSVSINEIEKSIIRQFRIGQRITSEKVKNAFFNTISNAVEIIICLKILTNGLPSKKKF
jgi:predicted ATP-binding protein involved in virulence